MCKDAVNQLHFGPYCLERATADAEHAVRVLERFAEHDADPRCGAIHAALFLDAAATMQATPSSCLGSGGAVADGAEPIGAVLAAQPTSFSC